MEKKKYFKFKDFESTKRSLEAKGFRFLLLGDDMYFGVYHKSSTYNVPITTLVIDGTVYNNVVRTRIIDKNKSLVIKGHHSPPDHDIPLPMWKNIYEFVAKYLERAVYVTKFKDSAVDVACLALNIDRTEFELLDDLFIEPDGTWKLLKFTELTA